MPIMRYSPSLLLIFFLSGLNLTAAETLNSRLQLDLAAGLVSPTQSLILQLTAAENPELLPSGYQALPLDPSLCPTLLAAEARALLPALGAAEAAQVQQLLSRPDIQRLPLSLLSPSGHFRLHYVTSGMDSTSEFFAQEAARSFDQAYMLLVEQMGFAPPPADGGIDGPELDIYIMKFYAYGETRFENPVAGSDGSSYTSYIVIDSKFTGSSFATQGIDALHVTAAHEFFHMLQGGYRFFPDTVMDSRFLFEASATWFEEVAYGEVNDYLQYVRTLFSWPQNALHRYSRTTYGLGIYLEVLERMYGERIIRLIWDELRQKEPLDALDAALRASGSDIGRSLAVFSVWNAFTASRADTLLYYHDGPLFPAITPMASHIFTEQLTITGAASELETHYYNVQFPGGGAFTLRPTLPNPAEWLYTVVIHEPGVEARHYIIAGNAPLTVEPLSMASEVGVALINIRWPRAGITESRSEYVLSFSPSMAVVPHEEGIVGILPAPFAPQRDERMQIQFYLPQALPRAALLIMTEQGRIVHEQEMTTLPPGLNCYFWNGRGEGGQFLPSGVYLVAISGAGPFKPHKFALVR